MEILGIDIGGSGVKAAVVDTKKGKLVSQKLDFRHLILHLQKNIFWNSIKLY